MNELPHQPDDEEIFRWHGALDITDDARAALEEVAEREGMTFEQATAQLQRLRYRHSQVEWPLSRGEKPYEKLPYHGSGISLITNVILPTGKKVTLTTHAGVATEIKRPRT